MLRGAVVGLGNVAMHGHLPAWARRRDVEIVAATDTRAGRRADLAARLPHARWHDTLEGLLESEALDFVDVCTPPSSHPAVVREALDRGLHVLCEKPLAGSPDGAAALARLADKSERVLHTVHNWHYAPIILRAAGLVRAGAIGEVTRVRWHTLRTQPAAVADASAVNWRLDRDVAGGGILTDHGWHVLYVVGRWIGHAPTVVRATLERRRHRAITVEDTATVRIEFPPATAEILLTWAADERRNWAEIIGSAGRLELRDGTLHLHAAGGAERSWECPPPLSDGSQHPEWFAGVAEEFVEQVRGRTPGGGNLAEAMQCAMLEGAARESDRRGGRAVSLEMTG
ncbi:MAG: Gfo/Idh/MocA family oxidoreductase [Candidatus Rokuibacteriota bacterium]